jgi:DNA-binding PadR family transcriptional regulator
MLLGEDSEIREELPQLLAQLEQQGYLERVGETRDGARFPLYRVTSAGVQAAEN